MQLPLRARRPHETVRCPCCSRRDLNAARQSRSVMKILYLNPTGQLGGAERSLLDVIESLRTAEPDWTLALIVGGDGPLVERARALEVATTVVGLPDSIERIGDAGAGGPAG